MRILVVNWQDIRNPLAGGAEVHLHEIFSRIARAGHEVTLYCSLFPGAAREETVGGIRVIREGGRYLFNYRVPLAWFSRFRRERFDLVVDDMNKIPFLTPLYVDRPLYVVTHHLFGRSIFLEVPWPLALYVYLMEKLGFGLCRRRGIPFIVGSPSTRQELIDGGFSGDLVRVINYCVDRAVHRKTGTARSVLPMVGYFGRLKKYKSVEQFLDALARIRPAHPGLRAVVVGEGDHRPALEQYAGALGLAECVRFTGFVDEKRKVELLQEVWFAVNTSSKEGWGLTVIEANACGTMVLASNVPGLRDAVRDSETGLLYEYGNIDDLSAKMALLLGDAALRERLGEEAFRWASTFDWDNAARETLGLLERRARGG
jgi:glycosyltransferase involved in cell wall biosynthesis